MKPSTQLAFIFITTVLLSGCASTSKYTLRQKDAAIASISINTTRKKTFPASNWLSESSGWDSRFYADQLAGRVLALPFYPITFLVDMVTFAHKTTYQTDITFRGMIPPSNEIAFSDKKILISGAIKGEFQTDRNGQFDKTFSITSGAKPTQEDYSPIRLGFSQLENLSNGTTIALTTPIAIEMTLKQEGEDLLLESRKELVPHIKQSENSTSRDILTADWTETAVTKSLIVTPTNFYSEKNKQITEAERIEEANRIQKKREQDELRNKEAAIYRTQMEAERTKRCAKQKDLIGNRHLCTAIIPQFIADQDTPNTDCIYLHKSEMYNPFVKVLSIANEGCVYYFDNSLNMIYNPEPIFIYKAGNPEADIETMKRTYPALRWMHITATCGDVDMPLPIGYYAYSGKYSYVALRGNTKNVYSFKKLDIERECID